MNTRTELWAKQDGFDKTYPLLAHLLDTTTIAGVLYDLWLRDGLRQLFHENLGNKAKSIVQCIAGLHDVGKASPLFQQRPADKAQHWEDIRRKIKDSGNYRSLVGSSIALDRTKEEARRHERLSAYASQSILPSPRQSAKRTWLHLALGGHHGRFCAISKASDSRALLQDLEYGGWTAAQNDLTDAVRAACHLDREDIPEQLDSTLTLLLSGLIVLADRIASGEPFVDGGFALLANSPDILEDPARWIIEREKEAVSRVRATVGVYSPWKDEEAAKHAILGDYDPRPIQQEALNAREGLWSLMATTGSGKTEAALLRHSTRPERLIFLLPTQATSNAIMRRVQHAYRDTSNVAALAHGLASVEDFYQQPLSMYDDEAQYVSRENQTDQPSGLYPSSFVRAGAARLFAPVCVGTIDQALASALPGKWIHFRLLALANAHIVIDEVHTLDVYQTKLLEELLPWLAKTRTRVTFLTATMPSEQRQQLISAYSQAEKELEPPVFPSIDVVTETQTASIPVESLTATMAIDLRQTEYDSLVDSHVLWHEEVRAKFPQARLGIICNTVARAQETAREIAKNGETVVVLHSRMTAEHRRQNAQLLLNLLGPDGTGTNVTVVGTQAIEASLDIDLDFLNTEICPAPSLVQRAGRQWRRNDPLRESRCPGETQKKLTVTWFDSDQSGPYLPYLAAEIKHTHEWLDQHSQLVIPDDAQEFIDSAHVKFENAITDFDMEAITKGALKGMRAESNRARITDALTERSIVGNFVALTTNNPADESTTRLIDEGSTARFILGGSESTIPGAWPKTVEELLALSSRDKDAIREALHASIPLSLPRNSEQDFVERLNAISLSESRSLLNGYYFVPNADQFYDAQIGFTGPVQPLKP
ncbi:CRISPR-associated helicase Cas3' [Arcanobacterium pinnipediorum]|uniref:CRISPR-associated helicase Cas3 n=1 Tax=Arcanobacterium pinnipediorum TaxID=1503041 RepID=A0ABY5AJJ2_9ACTO|nr:CRISPR-associated helicase Cas3' [Arcanobacterium pinnipediorum]USR79358.1 CRISPR-associated helicase Cas3' [Arcanobacterium pinnipediorum]